MSGSTYPGTPDDFNVPTEPEGTPLSEAGTSSRNHTEWHNDAGAAIENLESNAALKGHDHSGDAADIHKGPKLTQSNTHQSADTDVAPTSMHHTIDPNGIDPNKAAASNHSHDYAGTTIYNKALVKCVSTSRPVSPQLGDLIWEKDTNTMRVWSQFAGEAEAHSGLYSVDSLERVNAADMGNTLWQQTYVNGTGHGVMAIPDGHALSWAPQGTTWNRCIAQRINPADRHTTTQEQVLTFNTNEHVQSWENANPDNPTVNDAYLRMSDDRQTYVRAALTWYKGATGSLLLAYTTTGPTGEQLIGQLAAQSNTPNIDWQFRISGNQFTAYMGLETVGTIVDPTNAIINGNLGWGVGMQAGDGSFAQSLPNQVSEITIADATYYSSSAIWQLLPVGDMPKVALAAGHAQSINPTGSIIEWDVVGEDNFGFYNPALKTAVVVTEPGVYFVHASINWGTQLLGDHAATVIMVNDQRTPHMHWEFVRGFDYTPGFSQTVDVTAYIRLAKGDRVGVAAAHNGQASQFTGYKKSDQITQLSRFFMTFHSA